MAVVTFTEDNSGQAFVVHPTDTIELRVHENATTGYRWQLVRSDGLIEKIEPQPPAGIRPPDPQSVGAGGIRAFRFRPRDPGKARLELKLWREFEGDSSILKWFTADITITE